MKGPGRSSSSRDAQRVSISEKKKRLKALVGPAIALSSINWILQTSDVNKVDVIDKPLLLLTCSSLAHFGTSAARCLSCLKPKKNKTKKSGSSSKQIFHDIRPDHWLVGTIDRCRHHKMCQRQTHGLRRRLIGRIPAFPTLPDHQFQVGDPKGHGRVYIFYQTAPIQSAAAV